MASILWTGIDSAFFVDEVTAGGVLLSILMGFLKLLLLLFFLILGVVVLRVWFELLVVPFRIAEHLKRLNLPERSKP